MDLEKETICSRTQIRHIALPPEFEGIGPDGQPVKLSFADGEWFSNVCPDCGEHNGMGCINDKHTVESYKNDPYSPLNTPCIWCGKGPMEMRFLN
jgi:hypothetical protein